MKVLFVNMYYFPNLVGGTEHSLKLLAEGLCRSKTEVFVYTLDGCEKGSVRREENINGVKVYRGYSKAIYRRRILNEKHTIDKVLNGIHSIVNSRANRDLKMLVEMIRPDIIHTNNPVSISYWIWKYAKVKNIGLVHTLRDYWLLDPTTVVGKSNRIFVNIYRKYTRHLAKEYNGYITAPSRKTLEVFRTEGYFAESRQRVIVNCIEINYEILKENVDDKIARTDCDIKFIYAGSLAENKGIIPLLNAFAALENQNLELVICGTGPLESLVLEAAGNDKRIKPLGKLNKDQLNEQYAKCDVLVVPSIWEEPFGRIVIEGAQYGLPVIGSDRGGIPEIIHILKNGECIQPENQNELKNAMIRFSDRNYMRKYIDNIKDALHSFSLEKQVEDFTSTYKELLENENKPAS